MATNTNSKEIFDFYEKQQRKLKKTKGDSSTKNGQMYTVKINMLLMAWKNAARRIWGCSCAV